MAAAKTVQLRRFFKERSFQQGHARYNAPVTMSGFDEQGSPRSRACFNTTHWSVVLAAGQLESAQPNAALEALCRSYWYPLYAYVRRRGHSPHDAQDLTQGFFEFLLRGRSLAQADRERGRFRTFLLTAVNNFLHNEHDRAIALKRGGGAKITSWEERSAEGRYAQEPVGGLSPEQLFEKRWAATLLERVLTLLREDVEFDERGKWFDQLQPHLCGEGDATPYARTSGGAVT